MAEAVQSLRTLQGRVKAMALGQPEQRTALQTELLALGKKLALPIDVARDDAHVFLEQPDKLPTATWAQCAGVLRALLRSEAPLDPELLASLIARILLLAPTRH